MLPVDNIVENFTKKLNVHYPCLLRLNLIYTLKAFHLFRNTTFVHKSAGLDKNSLIEFPNTRENEFHCFGNLLNRLRESFGNILEIVCHNT